MTKEQTQIMQELLVYIDNAIDGKFRAAQAANEKSWFETELDKIDNGWGAVGAKLGHDNIAGHEVVNPQREGCDKIIRLYKEKLLSDLNSGKLTANEYILLELKRLPSIEEMMDAIGLNLRDWSQATPSKVPVERWKPEVGEYFWVLSPSRMQVQKLERKSNSELFDDLWQFGNCFPSEQEALAARDRVKSALKGE